MYLDLGLTIFLEGNEIKKVLQSLDSLEAVLPSELAPFLSYFRAFKKVRAPPSPPPSMTATAELTWRRQCRLERLSENSA